MAQGGVQDALPEHNLLYIEHKMKRNYFVLLLSGGNLKITFSAQIDTYGSTSSAIFPLDITWRNINISATKLLPALWQPEQNKAMCLLDATQTP